MKINTKHTDKRKQHNNNNGSFDFTKNLIIYLKQNKQKNKWKKKTHFTSFYLFSECESGK